MRRESILEDSYRIINSVNKTDLLKTKLWVEFEGEAGKLAGGDDWVKMFIEMSRQVLIMAAWPASGSSYCQSKCSILIMVSMMIDDT